MTAQIHENLILDGKKTSMAFCPPFPDHHPRIKLLSDEEIGARGSGGIIFSTACWREYVGTWEIKDNRFYLVRLEGRFMLIGDEPLFAEWFTGVLRVPKGSLLLYVHMGFGSVFEQEIHIRIENGCVVKTQIIDNRGKEHDEWEIGRANMPGGENRFPGDDKL